MAQHCKLNWLLPKDSNVIAKRIMGLLTSGETGVSLFFVLSGFLITYLLLEEKQWNGTISLKNFYMRRVLRIWPLYFAVLLFGFFIYPLLKSFTGMDTDIPNNLSWYLSFLGNFDLVHIYNAGATNVPMMIAITWSVAIEEQFYLVWPLLLLIVPARHNIFIFLAVIAGSLIFRSLYIDDDYALTFNTFALVGDLAMGAMFAWGCIYSQGFRNFFEKLRRPVIIIIYITGFLFLLFGSSVLPHNVHAISYRLVNTAFFAFIIAEQNLSAHSVYKYSRFALVSGWGKYTYALYLLHPIALQAVIIAFRFAGIENDTFSHHLLYIASFAVLSALMSYFSYHWFEKYFLRMKERFSPGTPQ